MDFNMQGELTLGVLEALKDLVAQSVPEVLAVVLEQTLLGHIWRPLVLLKRYHQEQPYHILCIGFATMVAYYQQRQLLLCQNYIFHKGPARLLPKSLALQRMHRVLKGH
jgi:hypothetical protein